MNNMLTKIKKSFCIFLLKQKQNIKNRSNRSYTIYKYCIFIALVPSFILFFTSIELYNMFLLYIWYLLIPLIFYAFLLDITWLIKKLWNSLIGKILYTIIGYFAYSFSLTTAKETIYFNTFANPDSFQASIHFFAGIFLIPSWILIITMLIGAIILSYYIVFIIYHMIKAVIPNISLTMTNIVNKSFKTKNRQAITENRIIIQSIFLILGSIIFVSLSSKIFSNIYKIRDTNFTKTMIIKLSYYPNLKNYQESQEVCNNPKIKRNIYIKLLDNNEVSVSNYKPLDNFLGNDNIKFKTMKCNIE